MRASIITVTPLQQNCSLLWCERSLEGVVVDPGGDLADILAAVDEQGVRLVKILLTHAHVDHVGGTAELARRLQLPIVGPQRDDQFWIDLLPRQCELFGLPPVSTFTPDQWLEDGDSVEFGEQRLEVIHCPGHTPGHVVFFHRQDRFAVVGDVLFRGSIGRTDFPRGDHASLLHSIRAKLFPLGDDVTFIPGHGPTSTFGRERRSNPFVRDEA